MELFLIILLFVLIIVSLSKMNYDINESLKNYYLKIDKELSFLENKIFEIENKLKGK